VSVVLSVVAMVSVVAVVAVVTMVSRLVTSQSSWLEARGESVLLASIGWDVGRVGQWWLSIDWCLSIAVSWCLGIGVGWGGRLNNLLLNNWCLLDDLLLGLVHNLAGDGLVLNALNNALLWDVLDIAVLEGLGDVLSLVFDCVVVDHLLLTWNVLDSLNWLILEVGLLVWDVLNTALALDWSNCGLGNLVASDVLRLLECWDGGGSWGLRSSRVVDWGRDGVALGNKGLCLRKALCGGIGVGLL
jgi:hypothetical protein